MIRSNFVKTLIVIFLGTALYANSQPLLRMKDRRVIRRTAIVILAAHKQVKEGKVYTGNLARAIAHQKYARILYRRGAYLRSIHQSRRARILAALAIKANKGTEASESKPSNDDDEFSKNAPSDNDLDAELQKEMPNEKMKDEDVLTEQPDVDIKE